MPGPEEAGPSKVTTPAHNDPKRRKRPPPLPPRPKNDLPTPTLKTLQGVRTRRNDTTHPGFTRDVVFVTRKVPLGALMGRCRTLLVDEGFGRITLFAMSAAIPHALLLLHALLDLLPYGRNSLSYEIKTGSVECVDDVEKEVQPGAIEENEPSIEKRIKSRIQIDLMVSPRPRANTAAAVAASVKTRPNRPSKKQRIRAKKASQADAAKTEMQNEEETMNVDSGGAVSDEEEEQVEEK